MTRTVKLPLANEESKVEAEQQENTARDEHHFLPLAPDVPVQQPVDEQTAHSETCNLI